MALYRNKYRIESARMPKWDYSTPGFYFVTICAYDHRWLFGEVSNHKMRLHPYGTIALTCIDRIPGIFTNVKLIIRVVMPNHVHAIIQLLDSSHTETNEPAFRRDVARNVSPVPNADDSIQKRDVARNVSPGLNAPNPETKRDVACNVSTEEPETPFPVDRVKMSAISPKSNSLSVIIRSYKSAVTNQIHAEGHIGTVWQPRFHDHIIRNDREYFAIRQYIRNNPANWKHDQPTIESQKPQPDKQPWYVHMP